MQAFDAVFANFGWQWLTPIVGIMLVTASLGGMLTWLAGPSKGLLLISRQEGYLRRSSSDSTRTASSRTSSSSKA